MNDAVDFNFAKREAESETNLGTVVYAAPEIFLGGASTHTKKLDVWSLGAILYEMCADQTLRALALLEGSLRRQNPHFRVQENPVADRQRWGSPGQFFDDTPAFLQLSQPARDLIRGMLRPDVEERFSIEDVLDSEWLN